MKINDKVGLNSPHLFHTHDCVPPPKEYTIVAIKQSDDFGSSTGYQVTPAVQRDHPDGIAVWYDAAHFHLLQHTYGTS